MGASHRSFARNFISKIAYGDGEAPAGEAGPTQDPGAAPDSAAPAASGQEDLASGLSAQYQVPLKEVLWVRAQGVSDADLPVVFMVAASAQVTPAKVVALLLAGESWEAIESQFSMQPSGIYYQDEPWGLDPCYDPALVWGAGWGGYWGAGYWGGGSWHGGGWNGWHGGGHWNGGHGGGWNGWHGTGHGGGQWNGGNGHWNGGFHGDRIGSPGPASGWRGGSHGSMGGPAHGFGGWGGGGGRAGGGGGGSGRSGGSHGR
jgi:hypothetical protein